MKLYELSEQYNSALDDLLYNEEIDDETRMTTLEALEGDVAAKGQAVAAYALNLSAEIDLIDSHIKAMQKKLKARKNSEQWLRNYLKSNMERCGITEIKANDGTFTAKITKGRESVVIHDESMLPASVMVQKEPEPSKTLIKQFIDEHGECPGACLERNTSLVIK